MNDEERKCGRCLHHHRWGIVGKSLDHVPLYAAHDCWCNCNEFMAMNEGDEYLPAMTGDQTKALWARTSFFNAQVPAATRMMMSGIMDMLELGSTSEIPPAIVGAVREFMGLVVSQITDMRGALIRDDNKFAHLVAHTDEIVESMKGVVQLSERLQQMFQAVEATHRRLDDLEEMIRKVIHPLMVPVEMSAISDDHSALDGSTSCSRCGHTKDVHTNGEFWCREPSALPACECPSFTIRAMPVQARSIMHGNAPLKDEPIVLTPDDIED